jgi:hypothetical protein
VATCSSRLEDSRVLRRREKLICWEAKISDCELFLIARIEALMWRERRPGLHWLDAEAKEG